MDGVLKENSYPGIHVCLNKYRYGLDIKKIQITIGYEQQKEYVVK